MTDRFSVELPARPEMVGTARLFASAVARHAGVPDEAVDDLRLAISEACAWLIDGRPGRLRVEAALQVGRLAFEVTGEPGDVGELDGHLGIELLRALFEGAEIEGHRVAFSLSLGGGGSG